MILLIVYCVLGFKSVEYCKYHIFNVRYEFTNSLTDSFIKKVLEGIFFGWLTIPVMILHGLFSWIFSK